VAVAALRRNEGEQDSIWTMKRFEDLMRLGSLGRLRRLPSLGRRGSRIWFNSEVRTDTVMYRGGLDRWESGSTRNDVCTTRTIRTS